MSAKKQEKTDLFFEKKKSNFKKKHMPLKLFEIYEQFMEMRV